MDLGLRGKVAIVTGGSEGIGKACEAGDLIAFLASERASYITGTANNVDGGTSAVV